MIKKLQVKDQKLSTAIIPKEEPEAASKKMKVDIAYTLWKKNIEQDLLESSLSKDNRFESPRPKTLEIYINES